MRQESAFNIISILALCDSIFGTMPSSYNVLETFLGIVKVHCSDFMSKFDLYFFAKRLKNGYQLRMIFVKNNQVIQESHQQSK